MERSRHPWDAFDLVVIRSTWDHPARREEFLAWADSLTGLLWNPAGSPLEHPQGLSPGV
jgi:hypothetical protein